MKRQTFLKMGCACGAVSLLGEKVAWSADSPQTNKKHAPQAMCESQVKELIKFIDQTQSDEVKEALFSQLGQSCFYSRHLDNWIGRYTDDVQAFLDWVNVEKKSRYWESLEFNEDKSVLTLKGRKVDGCACSFSAQPDPPLALCHICCRKFQETLFGMLLGQPVHVEVTTGYLLGDDRCNTVIHLVLSQ